MKEARLWYYVCTHCDWWGEAYQYYNELKFVEYCPQCEQNVKECFDYHYE